VSAFGRWPGWSRAGELEIIDCAFLRFFWTGIAASKTLRFMQEVSWSEVFFSGQLLITPGCVSEWFWQAAAEDLVLR
jgi:hypothetical protein